MLRELIEAEGRARILAAAETAGAPTASALADLDYLFSGQSPDRPGIWLAGGVTRSGLSVSGAGRTRADALRGVSGEMAETDRRAAAGLLDTALDWGFGAHPDRDHACRHAQAEALERACVMVWWRGGGGARALPLPPGSAHPARDLHLITLPAPDAMSVIIALSFDTGGIGFCFGAACRADPTIAAAAALAELAQSEFGLRLMQSRRDTGPALAAPDRLTLRLAQDVHRDHILDYVGAAGSPDGWTAADTDAGAIAQREDLGVFAGHLHVCAARLATGGRPVVGPRGPYADLPLYRA